MLFFIQLYLTTLTYETQGNMTLFSGNKPFYLKIYWGKGLLKKLMEMGAPFDGLLVVLV